MTKDDFLLCIEDATREFKGLVKDRVVLIHHNDADGLSAGAILSKAFERQGYKLSRYCLEQFYPQAFERILCDSELERDAVIVVTDMASGMLPEIAQLNRQDLHIFVLDHHSIKKSDSNKIHLVNCREFGIDGSAECSASCVAYWFARFLNAWNIDLSRLAFVGVYGDAHHDKNGNPNGFASLALTDALQNGLERSDETTLWCSKNIKNNISEIVDWVNALGSFGYYNGGPDIGIKGLLEGFDERYSATANKFLHEFDVNYKNFIGKNNIKKLKFCEYFILPKEFNDYGVKTVGLMCERLISEKKVSSSSYIIGFQNIPNSIPGLGSIELNRVKASLRVPNDLLEKVSLGQFPSIAEVVPDATKSVGGLVGSCHRHAGATNMSHDKIKEFVENLDSLIGLKVGS